MGVPGRQCLSKLRNTSLSHFDPLHPILELRHKVQSNSEWEKDINVVIKVRQDET